MIKTRLLNFAGSVAIAILFATTQVTAQSNSKGPDSPVVVGHVLVLERNIVVVRQSGEDLQRKLTVTKKTKVEFVGFRGIGEPADAPQKGFGVKAKVSVGDVLKNIQYTPPIPANREIADRHRMTVGELFQQADLNHNEHVDYVEFSICIHRSEKHGPDHFPKLDKDGDDTLGIAEFKQALESVNWWRLSRKSPEQWMRNADNDGNELLNRTEFAVVSQSGNHTEQIFKRTDKDRSGAISDSELEGYIEDVVSPKPRSKKK